jgi:hypothetical protein
VTGAVDYAAVLRDCVERTLLERLHALCPDAARASYYPAEPGQERPFVACGCGQVFDALPLSTSTVGGGTPRQPTAEVSGALVATDPVQSVLALIDPTKVYGPAEVEEHILDCVSRLETGAVFERECILSEHETHTAYDVAWAHAMIKVTGSSADVRKAEAFVATEDEYRAWKDAEMLVKAVKTTMHNLRSVLSGYQSVASSIRAAYQGTKNH